jgi:hypothetical protein
LAVHDEIEAAPRSDATIVDMNAAPPCVCTVGRNEQHLTGHSILLALRHNDTDHQVGAMISPLQNAPFADFG